MIFDRFLKRIKANCCCPHSWVVIDDINDKADLTIKTIMKLNDLKRTWLCTKCNKIIELSCLKMPISYIEKSK
jgi:hypothetical protein